MFAVRAAPQKRHVWVSSCRWVSAGCIVVDILSYDLTVSDEIGKAINKTPSCCDVNASVPRHPARGENPAVDETQTGV